MMAAVLFYSRIVLRKISERALNVFRSRFWQRYKGRPTLYLTRKYNVVIKIILYYRTIRVNMTCIRIERILNYKFGRLSSTNYVEILNKGCLKFKSITLIIRDC